MSRDTETFLRHCRRMADAARSGRPVTVTAPGQAFATRPRLDQVRVPLDEAPAWEALALGAAQLADQLDVGGEFDPSTPGPDDVPLL